MRIGVPEGLTEDEHSALTKSITVELENDVAQTHQ